MTASDWRGVLILPLLVVLAFCMGDGLVGGAAVSGFGVGLCLR